MVLTSHGAAQMAHWSRRRLRRTRRADVCGAAVTDVFPRATAYTARHCRSPRSPGDRARYQRRREGDRVARTAARRKAGGAVFSRQWRRIRNRVDRFRALIADGNGLIALSYRGYGGSTGRPTEAGLIADAEAAYVFAAARYPAERIALWG